MVGPEWVFTIRGVILLVDLADPNQPCTRFLMAVRAGRDGRVPPGARGVFDTPRGSGDPGRGGTRFSLRCRAQPTSLSRLALVGYPVGERHEQSPLGELDPVDGRVGFYIGG